MSVDGSVQNLVKKNWFYYLTRFFLEVHMFNYLSMLTNLGYFSIYTCVGILMSLLTFVLFFVRLYVFYKKGSEYSTKNLKMPKLQEVQLVFFGIALASILFMSFIPFIGHISLIISFIAFLKTIPEMQNLNEPLKIKPEKMAVFAVGLGIAGVIGFLLGSYRASAYKENSEILLDCSEVASHKFDQ